MVRRSEFAQRNDQSNYDFPWRPLSSFRQLWFWRRLCADQIEFPRSIRSLRLQLTCRFRGIWLPSRFLVRIWKHGSNPLGTLCNHQRGLHEVPNVSGGLSIVREHACSFQRTNLWSRQDPGTRRQSGVQWHGDPCFEQVHWISRRGRLSPGSNIFLPQSWTVTNNSLTWIGEIDRIASVRYLAY